MPNLKKVHLREFTMLTPEGLGMALNYSTFHLERDRRSQIESPDYRIADNQDLTRDYLDSLTHPKASEAAFSSKTLEEIFPRIEGAAPRNFDKPIVILTDRACYSTCELFALILEAHPHSKRVGEKTAGILQFSHTGVIVMHNSRLFVFAGDKAMKARDGRVLEKIGLAPHVSVAPGKDALEVAMKELEKRL